MRRLLGWGIKPGQETQPGPGLGKSRSKALLCLVTIYSASICWASAFFHLLCLIRMHIQNIVRNKKDVMISFFMELTVEGEGVVD